ncbi:cysteinyl-tRNA synthetase [SAR116 cluster alpha proteobacterium HIMB100]|nr:cysteinyl-tRNA synthetase [SAR116 cluster alpha proteobacterium HIMB100]
MSIRLYNTKTKMKQEFAPILPDHVRLYACGPTVYDRIHVGNARPLVIFDVLVRLLRSSFTKVTYVRNITDVDDKINARAAERGISIAELCEQTILSFHEDCQALAVLPPDKEPRATDHITQMIDMITTLIEKGFAYEAEGHVLFAVDKMPEYGQLSGRSLDEMIAGARVEVAPYKAHPADFVLWKPAETDMPGWDSPWGRGRPGWHIECSAMSADYLGAEFDIHAGGLDLIFPHHENEIAQSVCAHGTSQMAAFWVHNGYVTVEGEKMSKSLGNFTTVKDALARHRGEVVRFSLLSSHYRAPFDFSDAALGQARTILDKFYRAAAGADRSNLPSSLSELDKEFVSALCDDLNTPLAISCLHRLAGEAKKGDTNSAGQLVSCSQLLGLLGDANWFAVSDESAGDTQEVEQAIEARNAARAARNFAEADRIRDELSDKGIKLLDGPDGTRWERD